MSAHDMQSRHDVAERGGYWGESWERCEITWRRGYVSSAFVAIRQGDEPEHIGSSPSFRLRRSSGVRLVETPEAQSSLARLESELEAKGWERIEDEYGAWYAAHFRRRVVRLRDRIRAYSVGTEPLLFARPDAAVGEPVASGLALVEPLPAEPVDFEAEVEPIKKKRPRSRRLEPVESDTTPLDPELYDAKRIEVERLPAARLGERLQAERLEATRIEAERLEAERLEAERLEAEHMEAVRLEAERLEAERFEAERVEAARLEAERLEAERVEAERLEAERLEAERMEAERLETERLEAERLETERLQSEPGAAASAPVDANGELEGSPVGFSLADRIGSYSAPFDSRTEIRGLFKPKRFSRTRNR